MRAQTFAVLAMLTTACGGVAIDGDDGRDAPDPVSSGIQVGELGAGDLTVLVLFDKSGSMGNPWEGGTKWEVANEAFEEGLEGILDEVTIGAIVFPQPGGCDVAPLGSNTQFGFASGRRFWSDWQATSDTRWPEGGTPMQLAFERADEAIDAADALGLLEGRFRVLLVSDGQPTCESDMRVVDALVADWADRGVETQVLGLPGSAPAAAQFDAIAESGGTEEHQEIQEEEELDDSVYEALR